MRRITLDALRLVLLIASGGFGQSLGDVARENRENQKAKAASSAGKHTVVTNENLPKNRDADAEPPESERDVAAASSKIPSAGPSAEHRSAEEWKSRILAQKDAIAAQEAQIDKVNDSIHFVVANEYSNGVQYNESQVKKQEHVAQMRRQLEEQQKNLAEMQEAARRAGMGSAVYEP